ncbi:DinI-like family protein [Enterobacter chengduensis]|uniref:DinI-like family protein n=9 Tax=Enterobacter TaxID=547 RepID=UPI002074FBD3|nr:DinI-like family protein [Enterobacter chengduensis]MCM7424164.1 DinI family protein [Enterobacter chengduensis]
MFVELVYDKRNVEGLEGAREIILAELTKRVHQIFPDAEVKVKPMQANGLNSDASKSDREKLNRIWGSLNLISSLWCPCKCFWHDLLPIKNPPERVVQISRAG